MKAFVAVGAFLIILQSSLGFVVQDVTANEDELVAVAVLYRDGDKTPTVSFPNDPFFDPAYWPMGFGQLTQNGKIRQYQLGEWLRTRFNGFLPEEYNAKDIYVLSSDTDRTLASALVNLAGLYPPKDNQVWNREIIWQPIPVHTMPTDQDQILYMERKCPRYNELYEAIYNNSFFQLTNAAYADFYQEISELTGWKVDDVSYLYKLQQVLNVYEHFDETLLPPWFYTIDHVILNYLAGLALDRYTFTTELSKLGVGPFFDDLFTRFERVLDPTQEAPKFVMYSGHESTLASVLGALRIFDLKPPQFASCVIWELRRNGDGELHVDLFYKKDSSSTLEQLKLLSCDYSCKYETFRELTSPFTLDLPSWEIACLESK